MSSALRLEIEEMFRSLDGYAGIAEAYERSRSHRAQAERERRKFTPKRGRRPAGNRETYVERLRAWVATLSAEQMRDIRRRNHAKRKADPVRWEAKKRRNAAHEIAKYRALAPDERKKRNREQYQALRAKPERLARHRAYNREQMRRRRAAARSEANNHARHSYCGIGA